MPELFRANGPLEGIDEIPWSLLKTAYGSASTVPATLSKLAAPERSRVDVGWDEVFDVGLIHQDTVYSATAPAVPFIARIVASPDSQRRPRLILLLAFLALARDVPYSPAGTAAAVRQAVRETLPLLEHVLGPGDTANCLATAALAAAMPFNLVSVQPTVRRLFSEATNKATKWALAGALVMLGDRSAGPIDLLDQAEQETEIPAHTNAVAWIQASQPTTEDDRFLAAARSVQDFFVEDRTTMDLIYNAP